MSYQNFQIFKAQVNCAPSRNKRDWILDRVARKTVLDLGIIDHDLDYALQHPQRWLHGLIKEKAAFVVGVDILTEAITSLKSMGFQAVAADALTYRDERRFEVVVCGDLIEHVNNPLALLETIAYHLSDDGCALISTPNPYAISRCFNILADGWTGVNSEHICWFCPQTLFQLVGRSSLYIDEFCWLETIYTAPTMRRGWQRLLNYLSPRLANKVPLWRLDFGVVLRKRVADSDSYSGLQLNE